MEEWSELEQLVSKRRFQGTSKRTNITDAPRYKHKNGSTFLVTRIMSDVVREGPIFDQCVTMLGWTPQQIALNKNIVCKPHVDRNKGQSAIAFVGEFSGGALLVQEGDTIRRFDQPYTWYYYSGRDLHWNEEITSGTKYAVVCYRKKGV